MKDEKEIEIIKSALNDYYSDYQKGA